MFCNGSSQTFHGRKDDDDFDGEVSLGLSECLYFDLAKVIISVHFKLR